MIDHNQDQRAKKGRLLLLVEDSVIQANGMKTIIERTGEWRVEICRSAEEALQRLQEMFEARTEFPEIVSIDLGLPPHEEDPQVGLELLENISSRWKGIHFVVHTSLSKGVEDITVHEAILRGASFLSLKEAKDTENFSSLLNYIAEGYVVFSPKPEG